MLSFIECTVVCLSSKSCYAVSYNKITQHCCVVIDVAEVNIPTENDVSYNIWTRYWMQIRFIILILCCPSRFNKLGSILYSVILLDSSKLCHLQILRLLLESIFPDTAAVARCRNCNANGALSHVDNLDPHLMDILLLLYMYDRNFRGKQLQWYNFDTVWDWDEWTTGSMDKWDICIYARII